MSKYSVGYTELHNTNLKIHSMSHFDCSDIYIPVVVFVLYTGSQLHDYHFIKVTSVYKTPH